MNPIDDDELRELLPSLRRFALWLARDPADADDLVQACMERALSRWSTRRGDGSLKAWLFAIAHRQFIDQRRRAGRRSEEHTSELQSLMRISYAVFCLTKKTTSSRRSKKTL